MDILERRHLGCLLEELKRDGYRVVGPTVSDGAIVYADLAGEEDLPIGWGEAQEAGSDRLVRRPDAAVFGYTVGPHSWKKFLHPAETPLLQVRHTNAGLAFEAVPDNAPACAFIGVRACDLAALAVQNN